MRQARQENDRLELHVRELERRLTSVNALPAPARDNSNEDHDF